MKKIFVVLCAFIGVLIIGPTDAFATVVPPGYQTNQVTMSASEFAKAREIALQKQKLAESVTIYKNLKWFDNTDNIWNWQLLLGDRELINFPGILAILFTVLAGLVWFATSRKFSALSLTSLTFRRHRLVRT